METLLPRASEAINETVAIIEKLQMLEERK
jgi:hypothetical protein